MVIETVDNALAKAKLKKEVKLEMHSNITDTYTWTDYPGYFEKREKLAKAEGKKEQAIAIAKNSLKIGMSVADISKITGLTVEEIEALSKPTTTESASPSP